MKKIIAIALCGLFMTGLCGCNSDAKRAREAKNHADFMQDAYEQAQKNYKEANDLISNYYSAYDRVN